MKRLVRVGLVFLSAIVITNAVTAGVTRSPQVEYVSPSPGSSLNLPKTTVAIRLVNQVDNSSIADGRTITVIGTASGTHAGRVLLSDDAKTLIFVPDVLFTEGESVSVTLHDGLRMVDGSPVASATFNFTVTPRIVKSLLPLDMSEESTPVDRGGVRSASVRSPSSLRQTIAKDTTLPATFPDLTISVSGATAPGYIFLTNFGWTASVVSVPYLMIVDNYGSPAFYKELNVSCTDFNVQPNGHLTYFDRGSLAFYEMDSSYTILDSYSCGNGYDTDLHELRLLPNGHAILMGYDPEIVDMSKIVANGDSAATVTGLIIQELDRNKNVVFQWRSWDHFQITDATHESLTAAAIDYVHGNALELDGDGNLILSSRHMDEITKIDRSSGEIMWRMGGKNNQFAFVNDTLGYSHQHAIRRLSNGHFTMFDNGNYHTPQFSRALEYDVDETNKIATLVWQYRNTPDQFSLAMGYVQRLSNGNTLIGWGDSKPAVTEVQSNGKKVFEMSLPDQVVSYRAYRYEWNVGGAPSGILAKNNPVIAPDAMILNNNFPNPFNPSTKISFMIGSTTNVTLKVFNVLGQEVGTLLDGVARGGELETVSFDASRLASGVYYCRLASGTKVEMEKMILIK